MKSARWIVVWVLAVWILGGVGVAQAEEAPGPGAQHAAQGDALLRQGQVEQATKAWLMAARAEPQNTAYRERAMSLKRVVGLRRFVATNPPSERWTRAVDSLHLFYVQSGLPTLAVDVDRKAYDQQKTPDAAARLAEAYLAAGMNAEATTLLAPYSGTSRRHAVYHTIALARLGQLEAAQTVSQKTRVINQETTPAEGVDYARMWTLLGNPESALLLLKAAFERTPETALPALKSRVRQESDFASLAATPAFAQVLATKSKVPNTCSGGSSCGSCPNRGKCGH